MKNTKYLVFNSNVRGGSSYVCRKTAKSVHAVAQKMIRDFGSKRKYEVKAEYVLGNLALNGETPKVVVTRIIIKYREKNYNATPVHPWDGWHEYRTYHMSLVAGVSL